MDLKAELLRHADKYCADAGISKPRLATLVANDGKFFDRVEGGGGLTVKMYERFMVFFHQHPASERVKPLPRLPARAAGARS